MSDKVESTTDEPDLAEVERLLGRRPGGPFEVVVRSDDGRIVVIKNAPLLDSGRPMPTLYWLVGERERLLVGRLESRTGVRRAESELPMEQIMAAHSRYAAERELLLPYHGTAPRPSGGVGGTRVGVKCLHAHYAYHLAGGDDPVGRWVEDHLHEVSGEVSGV